MCDLQFNLVAWLDGELPPGEAASVAGHLETCQDCRNLCAILRQVSAGLCHYGDAVLAAKSRPRIPRWVPALGAVAAIVALALFLAVSRKRVAPPAPAATPVAAATAPSSPEPKVAVARHKPVPRKHTIPSAVHRASPWPAPDTAVEIAIPADAVFAPGVLPDGMRLFAEMTIAPDGSVREVRFRQ